MTLAIGVVEQMRSMSGSATFGDRVQDLHNEGAEISEQADQGLSGPLATVVLDLGLVDRVPILD